MNEKAVDEQVRDLRARKNGALEKLVGAYTQPLMAGAFAMGFSEPDALDAAKDRILVRLRKA